MAGTDDGRAPRIGVIGGADVAPEVEAAAERVGAAVARAGAVLVCGGRGGVMAAACRGAKRAGGLTVGVLPGDDAAQANPWVDVPIVTGMGEARNVVVARTSQALVAVDGGWGTLMEIAAALKLGRTVVGLDTWRLSHDAAAPPEGIVRADDADEAARLALAAVR
ncbi:MAG: TIGR00725 family protein [Myxococcota bacterium]